MKKVQPYICIAVGVVLAVVGIQILVGKRP